MNAGMFGELLEMVRLLIEKTVVMRVPISAEQTLFITFNYLVSGDIFEELKFQTAKTLINN